MAWHLNYSSMPWMGGIRIYLIQATTNDPKCDRKVNQKQLPCDCSPITIQQLIAKHFFFFLDEKSVSITFWFSNRKEITRKFKIRNEFHVIFHLIITPLLLCIATVSRVQLNEVLVLLSKNGLKLEKFRQNWIEKKRRFLLMFWART